MAEKLMKAQDLFLDKINQICNKFGLNNIMAQIYTILYLSSRPLSLDDMVDRLKISKGSASINIRALERYGAVRRVWVKGSRRDYYEAELNIAKVIGDRVKSMLEGRLVEIEEVISSSSNALALLGPSSSESEKGDIDTFKQRLSRLKDIHKQAKDLFSLFNTSMLNGVFAEAANNKEEIFTDEVKE